MMHFLSLFSTAALAASAFASPLNAIHSVHERRDGLPHGWTKRSELDRRAVLPMKIALSQSNLDKGSKWLREVSHPDLESYGEHWSAEDVANAFAPR